MCSEETDHADGRWKCSEPRRVVDTREWHVRVMRVVCLYSWRDTFGVAAPDKACGSSEPEVFNRREC